MPRRRQLLGKSQANSRRPTCDQRLFVSVVENNSFSQGGARLNTPQSTISRMISALEERLGARLLQRSTRKLGLTEAGQIYFERAKDRHRTGRSRRGDPQHQRRPSGLLRVLAPALREFHATYPDITVGLSLSDSVTDMIGLGYDVAIRLGNLQDSDLIASRLAGSNSMIRASPNYLARNDAPQIVEDLSRHNYLLFRSSPGPSTWRFRDTNDSYHVQVSGSLFADNGEALLSAALAGLGICYLSEWALNTHLAIGALVPVLPDYRLDSAPTPIQAVAGYRKNIPAKQKAFVGFLRQNLSAMPWYKG